MPQSLDAEKALLGSALLSAELVLDICSERGAGPELFYFPAHASIFNALLRMRVAKRPIDLVTVTQFLTDSGELDACGGAAALADLYSFVPTAANAAYYLDVLLEKWTQREIITVCTGYAARAYEESGPELLNEVERGVLEIGKDRSGTGFRSIKQLTSSAIDEIELAFRNRGGLRGISTGLRGLDHMTNGLQAGDMIVIAARPSMGKTALAMNIAEHVAIELKKAVAIYSLEMGADQLVTRMLCTMARISSEDLWKGLSDRKSTSSLMAAATALSESRIYIDDTPALPVLQFQASARRLHSRDPLSLIVVDYLQLMRAPTRAKENRQVEVMEISNGIKALAKELRVPVIALAQLNRNPDARSGGDKGKPVLSDLRESGTIEQDADLVGLLWRKEYYAGDEEEKAEAGNAAELRIAKHRNGPTGDIPLSFEKSITRFSDREGDGEK